MGAEAVIKFLLSINTDSKLAIVIYIVSQPLQLQREDNFVRIA